MQDLVDGAAVVFDVQVITHRRTVVVERQRQAVDRVGDQHRNQLLRVLVRSVVVRPARDQERQPEALRVGARDVLSSGLACGVRAPRPEGVVFGGAPFWYVAINLIRADQEEDLVFMLARRFAQNRGSTNVSLEKCEGIHQRAVDMSFGGEINDRVGLRRQLVDQLVVADVAANEAITRLPFDIGQVGEVAGVRELVQHRDLDLRARTPEVAHEIRADEARGARDKDPVERPRHLMGGPAVQS